MFLIIMVLGVIADAILLVLTVTNHPELLGAFIVLGCGIYTFYRTHEFLNAPPS